MKIFIVRGSSGYELTWIARAFTFEQEAKAYIAAASVEAKAKVAHYTSMITETNEETGESVQIPVVSYDSSINWATLLDPNFQFDSTEPDHFRYSIIETDLIG